MRHASCSMPHILYSEKYRYVFVLSTDEIANINRKSLTILLCTAHVIRKIKDSVSRIEKTVFKSLLRYKCFSFYKGYIIRDDWKGDSKISDADRQGK